jgi:hypothetical protein
VDSPALFILFFDMDIFRTLREEYQLDPPTTDYLGMSNIQIFLEGARRQGFDVSQIAHEELNKIEWKKRLDEIGENLALTVKESAIKMLLSSRRGINLDMNIPLRVVKGLKLGNDNSLALMFVLTTGDFVKRPLFGMLGIPTTLKGREDMLQYFRKMVSDQASNPVSDGHWKSSERIRKEIALRVLTTVHIEGLEENMWKKILQNT